MELYCMTSCKCGDVKSRYMHTIVWVGFAGARLSKVLNVSAKSREGGPYS